MAPHGKMRGSVKPKSIRKTLLRRRAYMVKNTWLLLFVVLMVIVSCRCKALPVLFSQTIAE